MRARRVVAVAAIGLTVVAALMLVLRLPKAVRGFDNMAAANAGSTTYDGALAAADSVQMETAFVRAAFTIVPRTARFEVLVPADRERAVKATGVSMLALEAAPSFLEDFLLPRREVGDAGKGDYVLCYGCDHASWDTKTRWLFRQGDLLIGLVSR